jgi:hypothetical protein
MAKEAQAVQKTEETTAIMLPPLQDLVTTGFENVGVDDTATPFLKLLQKMSPETEKGTADYIEGAEAGGILNSVTKQIYGGDTGVHVVPCTFRREYIEWAPRESSQGAPVARHAATSDILARTSRSQDNKDVLPNGNYVENTAQWYVILLNDDHSEWTPAMVSMKSTQLKRARSWMSMIRESRAPVMFSHLYKLTSILEQNNKGNWYSWVINRNTALDINYETMTGTQQDSEIFKAAYEFALAVKQGEVDATEPSDNEVPF